MFNLMKKFKNIATFCIHWERPHSLNFILWLPHLLICNVKHFSFYGLWLLVHIYNKSLLFCVLFLLLFEFVCFEISHDISETTKSKGTSLLILTVPSKLGEFPQTALGWTILWKDSLEVFIITVTISDSQRKTPMR